MRLEYRAALQNDRTYSIVLFGFKQFVDRAIEQDRQSEKILCTWVSFSTFPLVVRLSGNADSLTHFNNLHMRFEPLRFDARFITSNQEM